MDSSLVTDSRDAAESPWQRARLRVPREDGAFLARPALSHVGSLLEQNVAQIADADCSVAGVPLDELRQLAREEILRAAAYWTRELLGRQPEFVNCGPLIVSGHQPELFHPGVWVKNFAAAQIARQCGAVSLNLVVDNDIAAARRIRVPSGTREQPTLSSVEFDATEPAMPWEEAKIVDRPRFESFGIRVQQAMAHWSMPAPLAQSVWQFAVEHSRKTQNLGDCLTAARARLEHVLGFGNLELPIRHLTAQPSFHTLVADILGRAAEFRKIHNAVLAEFRRVNRVRSQTHPVPELSEQDGWIEVPFWIWKSGDTVRQRAFVKPGSPEVLLASAPDESAAVAGLSPEMADDPASTQHVLTLLAQQSVRLRPRALATTIYSRLILSDLFIHGIGGAKYDEMTDRILSRFFGIDPPKFLTLSATAYLPFAEPFPVSQAEEGRLRQVLWELQHNPQRYVTTDDQTAASLIAEKQQLVDESASPGDSPQDRPGLHRYRRMPEVNRKLAAWTAERQRLTSSELTAVRQQLTANQTLASREFAWCLYPLERIQKLIARLPEIH
ncbi:MAG: hypothetical protein ACYTGL_21970 [Planctomycetota bacterium]|jgi:hypothetical protein